MRARSMAKCYHRDFRERINAMPTKRTFSPRIAPLSSTGSTVAYKGAANAVEKLVSEVAGERAVYVPSKTNLGGAGGFALGFLTALSLGADAIWCADDDGRPADETVLKELYRVAEANQLHEVSPAVCNINDPGALAFPLRQGLVWRRRMEELEGDFLPGIASLFNGALISARAMEIIGVPDYRLFIRG